ncbi:MAG: ROK family transcriptional regulator [Demequina sp.]|nr:ROK family transcriptional regulator [Demequina sp.]
MRISTPSWTPHRGAAHEVALEVLINGPISRAQIARRLDLSAGSLTRLSQPLIEAGLIVEVGEHASGQAGRPSRLLDVIPESRHFIGLKLTGDEVLGAVIDLRANVIASGERSLTSREPSEVVSAIAALVNELRANVTAVTSVGLGIGGLVAADGTVISAPFLEWEDVELAALLEREIALPVTVANDLTAFTEYERWFGGGRNLDRFAVITLGAGIGYGLVAGGRVVNSDDAGLGLVGHWPIDPYGPLCSAGHRGCARTVLTQSAIASAVSGALDRAVDYDGALDLAHEGDAAARTVVDNAGRGLGHFIAAVANLTMPELVILGGEGVRLVSIAGDAVREGIAERRDPRAGQVQLLTTSGDNIEWCRGAAVLALQDHVLGAKGK